MSNAAPLTPQDPDRVGSYVLLGRLGSGGQGVVYLGRSPSGEQVAVKLLLAHLGGDPVARARFVQEMAAAKRVARFCTAQVLDAQLAGDRPYLVSEYVPGPSLTRRVGEDGPLSGGALERLAVGTATALAAIHRAGLVHRDFKPHNVIMGPDGPRVIDFGIAKALDPDVSQSGTVAGTPAYMAPEQIAGTETGPPMDLFAWAATMLFAASGRTAFEADGIPAVFHRVLNDQPDLDPLTGELRELVAACLSKEPAARPDAQQVLIRLLGQDGSRPVQAPAADDLLGRGRTVAGEELREALDTVRDTLRNRPAGPPPDTLSRSVAFARGEGVAYGPPRPRRGRRRLLLAGLAALVAIVVASIVAIATSPTGGGPPQAGSGGTGQPLSTGSASASASASLTADSFAGDYTLTLGDIAYQANVSDQDRAHVSANARIGVARPLTITVDPKGIKATQSSGSVLLVPDGQGGYKSDAEAMTLQAQRVTGGRVEVAVIVQDIYNPTGEFVATATFRATRNTP